MSARLSESVSTSKRVSNELKMYVIATPASMSDDGERSKYGEIDTMNSTGTRENTKAFTIVPMS